MRCIDLRYRLAALRFSQPPNEGRYVPATPTLAGPIRNAAAIGCNGGDTARQVRLSAAEAPPSKKHACGTLRR